MADKKISELNAATTLDGTELFAVVQTGETKQAAGTVLASLPTVASITDIGTAPNEVPLNQYLGALAYKDNVLVPVPVSATAAGKQGDIAASSTYLYVCVAANTWVRTALATW